MRIRTLALAFAVLALQPAMAQIITEIDAVEMSPSHMILPGSVNGMVTYRPCDTECDEDYERARLTASTRFVVNGEAKRFVDFQQDFAIIKTQDSAYALVRVDTKSRTITSIEISG